MRMRQLKSMENRDRDTGPQESLKAYLEVIVDDHAAFMVFLIL